MKKQRMTERKNKVIFDFYNKGIINAMLIVDTSHVPQYYSIQNRDIFTGRWSDPVTIPQDKLDGNEIFQSWGGLRSLPAQLKDIEEASWGNNKAVGWPDENSIYIKFRAITGQVDNWQLIAHYWGLKDGSSIQEGMAFLGPVDFIIGENNILIAAVDPAVDLWLIRRGYENFTTIKQWSQDSISPAKYGIRLLGNFAVSADDGTKLATLVYLPDDGRKDGRYPVILARTPYGIKDVINCTGHFVESWHYCARGYAVVLQAVRGTTWGDPPEYRSEGTWEYIINESADGKACLDWIVKQPWCNGNIGMTGVSYLAVTQWTAAMSGNKALKCLIPECIAGVGSLPCPAVQQGGIFYAMGIMRLPKNPEMSWDEIFSHRPVIEIDRLASGQEIPMWQTWCNHQTYDRYAEQRDWYKYEFNNDIAVLHIDGWYNAGAVPSRRNWELMKRKGQHKQRLIIGPWKHFRNLDRQLNKYNFGMESISTDLWLIKQKWFDRFLRGVENDATEPPVQYYVYGQNEWHSASEWPLKEVQSQPFYFHSRGRAATLLTDGILSTDVPASTEPSDSYIYDPRDPVPCWTRFDRVVKFEGDMQGFPYDYCDVDVRHDVLTYTSAPLAEDLTIAGDVMAVIYASCDVKDTDWWVRLEDIDEFGCAMSLNHGMVRARFRKVDDPWFNIFGSNFEKEDFLSGNMEDIVRYEISMAGMAITFKKGHRILVAVMNACDNYLFPNSNTGSDEARTIVTVPGKMTMHHSEKYPSHILLPVVRDNVL